MYRQLLTCLEKKTNTLKSYLNKTTLFMSEIPDINVIWHSRRIDFVDLVLIFQMCVIFMVLVMMTLIWCIIFIFIQLITIHASCGCSCYCCRCVTYYYASDSCKVIIWQSLLFIESFFVVVCYCVRFVIVVAMLW